MIGRLPQVLSLPWLAGLLDRVGGALLIHDLSTRAVALVLSGQVAVAPFIAHAPRSPFPALNGGDSAIPYCFVFLYLVFAGPGARSLDEVVSSS